MKPALGGLIRLAVTILTGLVALWGAAAIWIDGPASRPLAGLLVAAFLAAVAVPLTRVRPLLHACLWALAPCAAVACWWLSIRPSNDRDWQPDVSRTPTAERQGSVFTVRDVRDFDYRTETDFTERWEERRYDLDRVVGLDLFICLLGLHALSPTPSSAGTSRARRPSRRRSRPARRKGSRTPRCSASSGSSSSSTSWPTSGTWFGCAPASGGSERVPLSPRHPAGGRARPARAVPSRGERPGHPRRPGTTRSRRTARRRSGGTCGPSRRGNPFDWRLLANGDVDRMLYERGRVDTSLPFAELPRAERRHGAREGVRCPGRLLPLHPGGPADARGAAAVDSGVPRPMGRGERRTRG